MSDKQNNFEFDHQNQVQNLDIEDLNQHHQRTEQQHHNLEFGDGYQQQQVYYKLNEQDDCSRTEVLSSQLENDLCNSKSQDYSEIQNKQIQEIMLGKQENQNILQPSLELSQQIEIDQQNAENQNGKEEEKSVNNEEQIPKDSKLELSNFNVPQLYIPQKLNLINSQFQAKQNSFINIAIDKFELINNNYFIYYIRLEYENQQKCIKRRYSSFEVLSRYLQLKFWDVIQPPMPPKHTLYQQLDYKNEEFLNERKIGLEKYLKDLLSYNELQKNKFVQKFLSEEISDAYLKKQIENKIVYLERDWNLHQEQYQVSIYSLSKLSTFLSFNKQSFVLDKKYEISNIALEKFQTVKQQNISYKINLQKLIENYIVYIKDLTLEISTLNPQIQNTQLLSRCPQKMEQFYASDFKEFEQIYIQREKTRNKLAVQLDYLKGILSYINQLIKSIEQLESNDLQIRLYELNDQSKQKSVVLNKCLTIENDISQRIDKYLISIEDYKQLFIKPLLQSYQKAFIEQQHDFWRNGQEQNQKLLSKIKQ